MNVNDAFSLTTFKFNASNLLVLKYGKIIACSKNSKSIMLIDTKTNENNTITLDEDAVCSALLGNDMISLALKDCI